MHEVTVMTSFKCVQLDSHTLKHAQLCSEILLHPYLLGGECVLHEVEADRAHKLAVERARGNGNG